MGTATTLHRSAAALYRSTDYDRPWKDEKQRLPHLRMPSYITEFRADLLRVTQSPFFRRLQGKTQLLPVSESDYFRNRLTHSLEVATIAELIALKINVAKSLPEPIDQDLIRVAALCHDAGHPPFAHKGERASASGT